MKKLFALLAVFGLVTLLSLNACKKSEEPASEVPATEPQAQPEPAPAPDAAPAEEAPAPEGAPE